MAETNISSNIASALNLGTNILGYSSVRETTTESTIVSEELNTITEGTTSIASTATKLVEIIGSESLSDYILDLGVYQILTTNEENFIENVEREIEKIDHKIYHRYIMMNDEFEIEDFLNYVENEMGTCDPTIYVIVGGEEENYDRLDDRIKTIFDDRVYKGIKIIYKNKLYDYSLS